MDNIEQAFVEIILRGDADILSHALMSDPWVLDVATESAWFSPKHYIMCARRGESVAVPAHFTKREQIVYEAAAISILLPFFGAEAKDYIRNYFKETDGPEDDGGYSLGRIEALASLVTKYAPVKEWFTL